jgi:hypothetical protein
MDASGCFDVASSLQAENGEDSMGIGPVLGVLHSPLSVRNEPSHLRAKNAHNLPFIRRDQLPKRKTMLRPLYLHEDFCAFHDDSVLVSEGSIASGLGV